jgi:DNA-binding beta-propeller fold protein YncE
MLQLWRMLVALFAVAALAAGAAVASADRGRAGDPGGDYGGDGHHGGGQKGVEQLFTLRPDPAGNPEGIAFDKRTNAFYVSITSDGAIYRGTLGSDTVSPFIPGGPGRAAVGVKVRRGLLYVAGGPAGSITVYDLATKQAVAAFQTGAGGFLNDLVVTAHGDVFVTDSFRPTLWHLTAGQVRAGSGTPQALDVSAVPFEAGQFNLNGIVAAGSRRLVVVDSNSGQLFRIDLSNDRSSIRQIEQIQGATVLGGDGLLLDRGRLVVVQGNPAQLSFLKLRSGARRATLEDTQTSDKLRGPSTVDRANGLYLVVNADFAASQHPFTVAGLPRHKGRGHG